MPLLIYPTGGSLTDWLRLQTLSLYQGLFKFADLSSSPYLEADNNILKRLDSGKIESYKTALESGRDIIMMRLTPIEISATLIRKLLHQGKSIKYLLPEEVESYIISNKLYKIELLLSGLPRQKV